jgi:hypothetical protein
VRVHLQAYGVIRRLLRRGQGGRCHGGYLSIDDLRTAEGGR